MTPRNLAADTPPQEKRARTVTVMVIDDEPDLRDSICDLLAAEDFDLICAEDGEAALGRLRGDGAKPDVILLDLMMPRMDGWGFREAQRKDPRLASIPVVVMTASRHHPPIDADEILYKPVDPEHLLAAVNRHPAPAGAGSAGLDSALVNDRFVDMLGHDLRNPISAILLTGTLLSGQARDRETAEHAGRILDVVRRMNLTVSHLPDFLRMRNGQEFRLARKRTDLAEVCRRVVRSLARSTGRDIELVVSSPMEGNWDRERLELLLTTLLLEACDRDRSRGAVVVKGYPSGEFVRLEIEHGGGEPAERRPFQSSRDSELDLSPLEDECIRVGLGMTIVRQIVRAHAGEIHVESNPASTCVTVELPYSSSC